ncbi:uncharacterized protein G2W53_007485 [Senna tora]|uniref:Uncharacterized protein n=1 Tax=Senna tora TaxID=362788 RepID=A0A834X5G4_9FABA|nr:uncharacterized protein G2W53_007485 [Senna tora]
MSVTVFGRVIISGMLRGIYHPIFTRVRIRIFRTCEPNTFMGGVVLGYDAWAIAGNKKEGSALDSLLFGGRIGCLGGLNLPLFVQAYTFSIALTVAGSASLNSQSCQQMESHVKLSFLLSFGKVTCTMKSREDQFSVSFSPSTRAASSRGEELVERSTSPTRLGGATPDRLSWEKVASRALSDQMLVEITSLAFE